MSGVAFVSDIHLGNHRAHGGPLRNGLNARAMLVLETITAAIAAATREHCAFLVVAGDLFDVHNPSPPLIAAVQIVFAGAVGMTVVLGVGNHDRRSDEPGDNALAPLSPVAHVHELVAGNVLVGVNGERVIVVPYRKGNPEEWLNEVVREAVDRIPGRAQKATALAVHMGVKDERTPPWLQESEGAIDVGRLASIAAAHGIFDVFAGDWHDPRFWNIGPVRITQMGALCPTGWDNSGDDYGCVAVWHPSGLIDRTTYHRVPGPRFRTFKDASNMLAWCEASRDAGNTPHARLVASPTDLSAAVTWVKDMPYAIELLPDVAVIREAVERASAAARSGANLDAAIAAYVREMPLGDGVDRAKVERRARAFLRTGVAS